MELKKKLTPGNCPFCDIEIYDKNKVGCAIRENKHHAQLWVLYNDGTAAFFSVCHNCLNKMTMAMAKELQLAQRFTWGREIIDNPLSIVELGAQLQWYINTAIFLEVVKFARTKEGLQSISVPK